MISENIRKIIDEVDDTVSIVAATKMRSADEINEAIKAGVTMVGENYVQEARKRFDSLEGNFKLHLIGHLQKNKARVAVKMFDMIQTLDSLELARVIDSESAKIKKVMPVLIEINSAQEEQKNGVFGEDLEQFVSDLLDFKNIKLMGIMTMGPQVDNPEYLRRYFKATKSYFDMISGVYPQLDSWIYLSMGMSDSYKVAIEEGANMVRLGANIFGNR